MHASRRTLRRRSARTLVVAAALVVALLAPQSVARADDAHLPPAPAGFADEVVAVYQSEYEAAEALGRSSALVPVSDYRDRVAQSSPDQLAALYSATQHNPGWLQIPTMMQTVVADLRGRSTASLDQDAQTSSMASGEASVQLIAAVSLSNGDAPVVAQLTDAPVGPYSPGSCDDPPPLGSLFAMQIVVDVATGVVNTMAAIIGAEANAGVGAAGIVASGVAAAAQIVYDTLAYVGGIADDCASKNQSRFVANIDNTTVQTYSLIAGIISAITTLQATGATTLTTVQNIQTSLTSLQQTVQKSLNSATQTLQTVSGNGTQAVSAQLQTLQTALQQGLTSIQAATNTNNQALMTATNTSTTAIQSTLNNVLQDALHEVDVNAQQLTNLVTQGNQQILNTIESNFNTGQSEYYIDLKLDIEHALGTGQAQVQMKLPASMGGYLNSTPVGVAQVVNDDIKALQALKVAIQPSIISTVNGANGALAAGQWLVAFANFMKAYQSFAGA